VAIDALFKKEFDTHRHAKTKHPIMETYKIDALPFEHPDLDVWRDNFAGVSCVHSGTGLTVCGAVDDIWQDKDGRLIVVDYKATAKDGTIVTLADSSWETQYKRQIGVYQWLLKQNGFEVAPTGYFVYANAHSDKEAFDSLLEFEVTLVPCEGETDWIEPTLVKIKECLERNEIPPVGNLCEHCPYREAAGKKLQALHKQQKK
jgi:hypothetical protein